MHVAVYGIDDDRSGEQKEHGGDAHPIVVNVTGRFDARWFTAPLVNRGSNGGIEAEIIGVDHAILVIVELVWTASIHRRLLFTVGVWASVQRIEDTVLVVIIVLHGINAPVAIVVLSRLSRPD